MDSTALALTLGAFGLLLIALSYQRHRHRRDLAALGHGISGAALFLAGVLLLALTLNLDTYERLTPEEPVAELSMAQVGPQTFRVRLMRIPAGDLQVFTLKGNRWQIEARLLTWHGWTQDLGLDANIRLETLHSSDDRTAGVIRRNSYRLNRTPGIRLVELQQSHPQQLDFLSSTPLMTEPLPLEDGLRYHVYASSDQLQARAINHPKAVKTIPTPVISYQGVKEAAGSYSDGISPGKASPNLGRSQSTDASKPPGAQTP
jgi:hypothetical protein